MVMVGPLFQAILPDIRPRQPILQVKQLTIAYKTNKTIMNTIRIKDTAKVVYCSAHQAD